MAEILATITSKGQVTIPAEVRKHLGLDRREKIAFVIDPAGDVHLQAPRYPSISALRGAAGTLPRPMLWQEVREIVADEQAEELRHKIDGSTP